MVWNLHYDYSALAALTLFGIYVFSMRQVKYRVNTIFNVLLVVTYTDIILDICACVSIKHLGKTGLSLGLAYAFNVAYFVFFALDAYLFFLYIQAYTERLKKNSLGFTFATIPIALDILVVLATPATHWLFELKETVTPEGAPTGLYTINPTVYTVHFLLVGMYFVLALAYVVMYRKYLTLSKKIAIYSAFVLLAAAVFLQFAMPYIIPGSPRTQLVGISMAFSLVAIYLSRFSTGDAMDRSTDAFNKRAFYLSVSTHIDDKHPFSVIAFEPDNFDEVINKYGEDKANLLMRQISEFMHEIVNAQALFKLDGNTFAILLGANDKYVNEETFLKYYYAFRVFQGKGMGDSEETRIVLQALSERFEHVWYVKDEKINLTTSICYLRYPEDVQRADEVNDMINGALRQAHSMGSGTILYAVEYRQTREAYINELQAKQEALEKATHAAEDARKAAEQANASKTRFLSNMSHEIRTPMNAIMGMTELVLRDDVNDQVRKNVSNIQSAGNTLLTIINDILDFSKIEADKMEIVNASYETGALLNNVLSISTARLAGKNLELIADIDPTIPSRFKGDEMRLRQIIINLLGNAIKYTERGSVTLKVRWERIETEADEPANNSVNLKVSIIDTGSGIKDEDLNKLFKSFSRIETEKNHLIEGTGLGLSIVKRLLDIMGGTITVESEYGKGSNFTFTVPQEVESVMPFAHVDDAESKNALVYTETASLHNELGPVLKSLGIQYTVALTVDEMIEALENMQFTHIFVEYSNFSSIWESLKGLTGVKVVVMIAGNQVVESQSDLVYLREPFFCLNVAESINDVTKKEEIKVKRDYFTAPDARVLVVDDNTINIQILVGLMKPHKLQVDSVESGKECLKRMKENEYDLVLMDHMMPEMDGVETLHAIRAMEGDYYKNVPVVVVTANAMSGVQEEMEKAGFQNYISKPINVDKLESVLLDYIPIEKIRNGSSESGEKGDIITLFIPGMNVHMGIESSGRRLDTYIGRLNSFLLEGNKRLQSFERCIRDDDYRGYENEAKNLRVEAAGLGADVLADMAKEQEKGCREGRLSDVRIQHNRFCDTFRTLLRNVEEALSDSKVKLATMDICTKGRITDEEALERLTVIQALLSNFNQELAKKYVLEGCEYAMSDEIKAAFVDAKAFMENLHFDAAEQYLKEFLEKKWNP
ncbi:MAG: response regulator [Lachnospiraceae bacterium]|nr:response regulator [Lachnospiraceae bacterium]